MTESILQSRSNFTQHLLKNYDFLLTEEHGDLIEWLIERDKDALCRLLYRFENHQMVKRKASRRQPDRAKKLKEDFVRNLQDAADSCQEKEDTSERDMNDLNTLEESFDASDPGLDRAFLEYVTPDSSQILVPEPPSSGTSTTKDSTTTSPPVSHSPVSSQSSNEVAAPDKTVNYIGEDLKQLEWLGDMPYSIKYFLVALISRGHLSWSSFSLQCGKKLRKCSSLQAFQILRESPDLLPCANDFITESLMQACEELDKEDELLQAGSKYLYNRSQGWIGGKVSFTGSIALDLDGEIQIRLSMPKVDTSSRFTRRFGSSRFFRIQMPKSCNHPKDRQRLMDYFKKPIIIFDRRFHLLSIRDSSIHLFEVRDDLPSISSFLNWHGPWEDNREGRLLKYLQRLALGISTSIPGPFIPSEKVRRMADVVSSQGNVMTDGAAPISRGAMKEIASQLGLPDLPSAVQGRYNGAKGIWYLDSNESEEKEGNVWIGVRDSQLKLERSKVTEECHQTLDVLRTSTATTPSCLSKQIISVLSHNGVPNETLVKMQEDRLKQIITQSFGEDGRTRSRLETAKVIDEMGGVSIGRARSDAPHLARVKGLISRRGAEDRNGKRLDDDIADDDDSSTRQYKSPFSKAYDMCLVGFEVDKNKALADLVVKCTKIGLDRIMEKFSVNIERSTEVLVIPDPVGVLQEGEVQLRFGRNNPIDPITKASLTSLRGNVLVTRHPCLNPIDIQKVKATTYPELRNYTDVIVFSTKGQRSLADLLSGGDYDGDTIRVFWEPSLVEPFQNAIIKDHQPSIQIDDAFDRDVESVEDLISCGTIEAREERLQKTILSPLRLTNSKGIYGKLHMVASYMLGLDHQATIDIGFKFNTSMDGAKTGLIIKPSILSNDNKLFDRSLPDWSGNASEAAFEFHNPPLPAKRAKDLPPSVFDVMWKDGRRLLDLLKRDLEKEQQLRFPSGSGEVDCDLISRFNEAVSKNRINAEQRNAIILHCESTLFRDQEARGDFCRERRSMSTSPQKRPFKRTTSVMSISAAPKFAQVFDFYRGWVDEQKKSFEIAGFLNIPQGEDVKLKDCIDEGEMQRLHDLVASCLYIQACEKRRFKEDVALEIAWSELLSIKAHAVSKVEGRPSITLPPSSTNALRLRRSVAARVE